MATPHERKFAFSYVERGKQFVSAEQYPEALEALREAVWRDPTMIEAWILLASIHYTLGEDIECLGATEEALKHNPGSGAAWNFRGLALSRSRRDEEALDAFARAMRIDGWFVTGARNAFDTLTNLDRLDEALSLTNALLDEQKNNGHFWAMRSAALRLLNKNEQAYSAANKAVHLAPENGYAWLQLAVTLTKLRRYVEALEACERGSDLQGGSQSGSWRLRPTVFGEQRRFSEALASGEQAQSVEPRSAPNWNQVGNALLNLGRPAEAYAHFVHATALDASEPSYPSNAGLALAHLRKYERALVWMERSFALRPGSLAAAINRTDSLIALERYEDAQAQIEAATEAIVAHSGYWAAKASLHTQRGEYNEALAAIKRAIDLSDDDDSAGVAYERMGQLLIALEDYAKALKFAELGLAIRPHDFCLQELKAKGLRGLGRESEADDVERTVQVRLAEQLALLDQAERPNG